jgi:HK97 family phage prohead protease
MEWKVFSSQVKQIEGRVVTGIASVFGVVDDGGDRLHRGAFTKTLQERGPRIRFLWGHDASKPPTAVIREIREVGPEELPSDLQAQGATGGLLVVREYLPTSRGEEVLTALKAGAITEMSFGFDPIKVSYSTQGDRTIREVHEVRLWEVSDVLWGMNSYTLAVKMVIPYKNEGQAPEDEPWERPRLSDFTDDEMFENLSLGEKRRIAAHFAWSANNPPETFGDLKLPHHRPSKTGIGPAVWSGVRAAMAALMGAHGGVDIPEGDRRLVYEHLARHYREFDREPPEFHAVECAVHVAQLTHYAQQLKEGRVLSKANLERIRAAVQVLQELLALAEPPENEEAQALTKRVDLSLQVKLRELESYLWR